MQTFRIVWLLRNLTYDGELCLCDGKNAAFFSPSLAVAGKHGKRHAMTAHKQQAACDWSLIGDHLSLWYHCIFSLKCNLLINYKEITRSI